MVAYNQAAAVILFTIPAYITLIITYRLFRNVGYNIFLRNAADKLLLCYRPPTLVEPGMIGGFYEGREVALDILKTYGKCDREHTRIRAFHNGKVDEEFAIGCEDDLRPLGRLSGLRRIEKGDPDFDGGYRVCGGDTKKVREYVDDNMMLRIKEFSRPFTVGKYDVSYVCGGRMHEVREIRKALDFLALAAARADKMD
jgi:hypothetical protein